MAKRTKSYGLNNPLQDTFPVPVKAQRAPTTRDAKAYELGQIWVDQITAQIYGLSSVAGGSAVWALLSPGDSEVDTLTGDSGGPRSPVAGNMVLEGGTNITSSGAGSTITFDMDDAITLATSISSPTYTTSATVAGLTISDNNIDADGTQTNIPINLIPKGTGDVRIETGNLLLAQSESQIVIKGGSPNDSVGQTILVAGTKVVANTNIGNLDKVFVSRRGTGLSTALGILDTTISSNSFTINARKSSNPGSLETNDKSIVDYLIIREL